MSHPFHKMIGDLIKELETENTTVLLDPACGGPHEIPLYCDENKSRETKYCNVDILILKDDKIKVILEIEESNIKPLHLFGKFLASAMADHYIYDGESMSKDDGVLFVQILDTSSLDEKSSKIGQFGNVEESIDGMVPLGGISEYVLFHGSMDGFVSGVECEELDGYIDKILNK